MHVSSQIREIHPFEVETTTAKLQDYNYWNFNELTKLLKPDIFHLIEKPVMSLENKGSHVWTSVAIGRSLNALNYSRVRFNFLDVLAAFGGFMGIWRWLFTTFMAAWNTNALDNFMVSKLYKLKTKT